MEAMKARMKNVDQNLSDIYKTQNEALECSKQINKNSQQQTQTNE